MASPIAGIFSLTWLITLAGGLIVAGALAALTNDSEVSPIIPPYRLAWTAWSLEVVALLVGLFALVVGPFRHWRATVVALLALVSPTLIGLTNDVLVARGALPGSNGSDSRANALAAGLIVVVTGNYLLIILAALHDTREPSAATHGSDKDLA